ncbi:MAG TPA: hypothetical protein VFE33_22665 [Thermoanaerobaculia bacterium]|nr:hypothetical protein [Thermoanaerobaculia bacterium]
MSRKLVVLAIFVCLGILGPIAVVAASTPTDPVAPTDPAAATVAAPSLDLALILNPAAEGGAICPGAAPAPRPADDCTPYGYLCDPRYVMVVCCPGTHCFSPYPGVPQYCL